MTALLFIALELACLRVDAVSQPCLVALLDCVAAKGAYAHGVGEKRATEIVAACVKEGKR